jgi:hypothetical protein
MSERLPRLAASRAGWRVTCSRNTCLRPLPGIVCIPEEHVNGQYGSGDVLFIPDGWSRDTDGRWTMNPRAASAFRQGWSDARRRRWARHDAEGAARPGEHGRPGGMQGWIPWNLPVVLVCPSCETPLAADPATLRVNPRTHQHRERLEATGAGQAEMRLCCNSGRDHGVYGQFRPPSE